MTFRYVPLLRSKTGEAVALENLSAATAARLLPVVHLVQSPPAGFAKRVGSAWNGKPMALDGLFNAGLVGSTTPFTTMFRDLGKAGVSIIPSVTHCTASPYLSAVQSLVGKYGSGLVVKVKPAQVSAVAGWVQAQGWSPKDIDLVVDAEDVANFDLEMIAPVLINALQQHIVGGHGWRSVTLAGAAAPKDHSQLATGRTDVPRLDWQIWQVVHAAVGFKLDYGDYGVSHPDLSEPPGIAMARATVSARYTTGAHWIVIKGRPISGKHGQPMPKQYLSHAKAFAADGDFGGLQSCWGDDRIQQIAAGKQSPGNRTTWVQLSVNRHISVVGETLP